LARPHYCLPARPKQDPPVACPSDADLLDALRRADRRGRIDLARRLHSNLIRRGLRLATYDLAGSTGGRS
jgi:hypothetical protein